MMKFTKFFYFLIIICVVFYTYTYYKVKETSKKLVTSKIRCRAPTINITQCFVEKKCLKKPMLKCMKQRNLITRITLKNGTNQFLINDVLSTNNSKLSCCYSVITRDETFFEPDKKYRSTKCETFTNKILINEEFIVIKCFINEKLVYGNSFVSITNNLRIKKKKQEFIKQNHKTPMKILLLGIDGVSRSHFHRALPKLSTYLQQNNWIELTTYNKVGENTFPNLMALLTGLNESSSYKRCINNRRLDICPFIWKTFSKHGFLTAYFEDNPTISTFNYDKSGFKNQPTDFYGQTYLTGAESLLETAKTNGIVFCIGNRQGADIVLENSKNFALQTGNLSAFGFFWINGIAHSDSSVLYSYEEMLFNYIKDLYNSNITEEFIIFFLSDHGDRFGPLRSAKSGYAEERLPFFYMSFPKWFTDNYSEYYQNLIYNKDILTTPYDIYLTLQHFLNIYNPNEKIKPSSGCPKCQTLFEKVSEIRTCLDVGITNKWCACGQSHKSINSTKTFEISINYVIDYMNNFINYYIEKNLCAKLQLSEIIDIFQSEEKSEIEQIVIKFKTKPGDAIFEVLLNEKDTGDNLIVSQNNLQINRINAHHQQSKCIFHEQEIYKRYCFCIH